MKLPKLFYNRVDKEMIVDYTISPKFISITTKRYWQEFTEVYNTDYFLNKYDNER